MPSAPLPTRDAAGTWMSCRPGQVIANEYEIKSLLGYGGVGEVYLAHHRTLKADFALKILLPRHRAREDVTARFRQESRALWELSHPSFVQVHHAGDDAVIGPYIAMEVLEGRTLAALGKTHIPKLEDAMSLGIEIAEAAEVMHSLGIIHRDLKPENIFIAFGKRPRGLASGPRPRRVKLLDLGAAKIARFDRAPTEDHQTVGTGRYMSPEHVQCQPLTPASDVYALAHIIFEFITRAHPFADAPEQPSHFEFQLLHRDKPPRALVEVMRGAPRSLSDLLLQAMAKSPRDRFQSMSAFAHALNEARRLFKVDQSIGKTERMSVSDALATIEDALLDSTLPDPERDEPLELPVPLEPIVAPAPVALPAAEIATLVELDADGATRAQHALAYGEFVVGRSERADIRIAHIFVSNRHARLCVHKTGIVEVFDEGSASGTFVNDEATSYAMLSSGDRVRFGGVRCEFRMGAMAEAAASRGEPEQTEQAPLPLALASSGVTASTQVPVAASFPVLLDAGAMLPDLVPRTERLPPDNRGLRLSPTPSRWPLLVGLALVLCAAVFAALWIVARRP